MGEKKVRMQHLKLLRPLRVDIELLELAFESAELGSSFYLDIATGGVVRMADGDLAVAEGGSSAARMRARRILAGIGQRYLPIPQDDPSDGWGDMAAYIDTLDSASLQHRLRACIRGKQPIRRFRCLLDETVGLEEWSAFQQGRTRERILDWLVNHGFAGFYEAD